MKSIFFRSMGMAMTGGLLLAAMVGCRLTGTGDPPSGPVPLPPEIVAAGELRVGLVPGRPPYLFADATEDTGFAGFEMRLLKALATKAGLPLRLRAYATEATLFAALRAGDIDLAVPAASTLTIARHFHLACARHLTTGQRCVVRREVIAFLASPEQLDRPEIIMLTVVDTVGANLAATRFPRARHEVHPDLAAALARLSAATGGVLLTDARTAWELADQPERDLGLALAVLGQEQLAWAVRHGHVAWQQYLDDFMAQMAASGSLAVWSRELGIDAMHQVAPLEPPPPPPETPE